MSTFFVQGNHATNLEGPKYEISTNILTFLSWEVSNAIGVCYAKTVLLSFFWRCIHVLINDFKSNEALLQIDIITADKNSVGLTRVAFCRHFSPVFFR